jgi:hypothetical protein
MIHALATDPRFMALDFRKMIALELIAKEMDDILGGDDRHPTHWMRIVDICRQEAGLGPLNALGSD